MRPGTQRVEAQLRARHVADRNARLDAEQPNRPLGSADARRGSPTPDRGAGTAAHLRYLQGRGPAPYAGERRHWTDVLP
jgi:hypothetical protein